MYGVLSVPARATVELLRAAGEVLDLGLGSQLGKKGRPLTEWRESPSVRRTAGSW